MRITSRMIIAIAALSLVGCGKSIRIYEIEDGQIGLGLMQIDEGSIGVFVVNRTESPAIISGLFDILLVQSPITISEVNPNNDDSSARPRMSGMPHLIDSETYRLVIPPGKIHGEVLSTDDVALSAGLTSGRCYVLRATYSRPDRSYTDGVMPSQPVRICL